MPPLGQGRLPGRRLAVRQQLGPLPRERQAAPPQVPGRPHGGRSDGGRREPAAAEHHGHLLGVDRVVCGLATMDGWQSARVPEDKRAPCLRTQVREPVPGAEACDSHDHRFPRGRASLEKGLWTGLHVSVQPALAILVQDTDGHAAGVEGDATIRVMLCGVKSPEVSSSLASESFLSVSILP